MTIICPNHHTVQEVVGFVSDTIHKRPSLACGCTPSQDELPSIPLSTAVLPSEPVMEPLIIEVDQFDPATEEARIRALVAKVLNEFAAAGATAQAAQTTSTDVIDGKLSL